jgi:hypothetical protein
MPSLRRNDVYRDNFDLFLLLFLRFFSQDIERLPPTTVRFFNSDEIHTSYRPMWTMPDPHPGSVNKLSCNAVCHLNISNDPKCYSLSAAI